MELSDRMKCYEQVTRIYLPPKTYGILRIDGKNFGKVTQKMDKPFDAGFMSDMAYTAQYVFENVDGAMFAFHQSDEISVVFSDLQNNDTEMWFAGNVQKIASVVASMATAKFNQLRFKRGNNKLAHFDCRVFSISQRWEALNYLNYRQRDCTRNSIQMLARSLFSHKECMNKNTGELQEMCWQRGQNWNDLATPKKRGTAIFKRENGSIMFDLNIPIFSQNWNWFDGKII